MAANTVSARKDGTVASCVWRSGPRRTSSGTALQRSTCTGAAASFRQVGSNKIRLIFQHKGIHTAGIGRIRQDIPQTGTIQAKTQDCPQIVTVTRHGAAALLRRCEMQHRNWLFRPGIRWFNAEHFAFRIRPAALKAGKIAALTVERGLCKGLSRPKGSPLPAGCHAAWRYGRVLPPGASKSVHPRSAAAQSRGSLYQKKTPLFSSSSSRSPIISTLYGVMMNVLVATRLIWPLLA